MIVSITRFLSLSYVYVCDMKSLIPWQSYRNNIAILALTYVPEYSKCCNGSRQLRLLQEQKGVGDGVSATEGDSMMDEWH